MWISRLHTAQRFQELQLEPHTNVKWDSNSFLEGFQFSDIGPYPKSNIIVYLSDDGLST